MAITRIDEGDKNLSIFTCTTYAGGVNNQVYALRLITSDVASKPGFC